MPPQPKPAPNNNMPPKAKTISTPITDVPSGSPREVVDIPPCPVTLKEFIETAIPLQLHFGDEDETIKTLYPKEFNTGSFGWHFNEKMTILLPNGIPVRVQANMIFAIIDSKKVARK